MAFCKYPALHELEVQIFGFANNKTRMQPRTNCQGKDVHPEPPVESFTLEYWDKWFGPLSPHLVEPELDSDSDLHRFFMYFAIPMLVFVAVTLQQTPLKPSAC